LANHVAQRPKFWFFMYFYTQVHDSMRKDGMILFSVPRATGFNVLNSSWHCTAAASYVAWILLVLLCLMVPERQKPAPCSFSIELENRKNVYIVLMGT
jgi:hypothetical protein